MTDAAIVRRWTILLVGRKARLAFALRQVTYWRKRYTSAVRKGGKAGIAHATASLTDRKAKRDHRQYQVDYAKRIIARHTPAPLRLRALEQAKAVLKQHVTEQGGNNRGTAVEKIIKEGGGLPGQAWCGWFMAAVYKRAGSKAMDWHAGAVRLWLGIGGVKVTTTPRAGNAVRYTFDHIGMFVGWCDPSGKIIPRSRATHILTIEGNTGTAGAVSDNPAGGDGVYEKVRPLGLVRDFLDISR